MTQDKILILDFGSQVTQLIARRVREAHVYCELHPYDMPLADIKAFNPKGIILSGGPNSVYDSEYQADTGLFDLGVPVLGICYGMQFMAHHLGWQPARIRLRASANARQRAHQRHSRRRTKHAGRVDEPRRQSVQAA